MFYGSMDNKIIIDEELGKQLTKEGKKRFKRYFCPKVIAKKLGGKVCVLNLFNKGSMVYMNFTKCSRFMSLVPPS